VPFQPSRDGRVLNVDATLEAIAAAVFSTNRTVPLQFTYTPPQYPDTLTAAELGITQLVSEGVSYYTGSTQARLTNIHLSAERFDGLIVAPGETFSFNAHVGEITPEEGYVDGAVIMGDRTVRGIGGGVCQTSTTAFRAAFYAGYPVTEWHAHAYRVSYYEIGSEGVGMDVAIYTPDLDFRFINDTPHHLLIETEVNETTQSVHFRFYSGDLGRTVEREGPIIVSEEPPSQTLYEVNPDLAPGQTLQVDWPANGGYVELFRHVYDSSGVLLRTDRFSRQYQPHGAVIQVAPGDPRANI
jgi:vancomycin resistance protein YoaR